MKIVKHINFFKLRKSIIEVKEFIENETGVEVISLKSKLVKDLYLYGDDNRELLERFISKYKLNSNNFKYLDHFHSEYELFGTEQAGYNLIKIVLFLFFTIIRILSFGKLKYDVVKLNFFDVQRQVTDMTIGDLVTWYLEKEYKIREEIQYQLI